MSLETLFLWFIFIKKSIFYFKCNVIISFKFVSAREKVVQYAFLAGDARVFHENGNEAS